MYLLYCPQYKCLSIRHEYFLFYSTHRVLLYDSTTEIVRRNVLFDVNRGLPTVQLMPTAKAKISSTLGAKAKPHMKNTSENRKRSCLSSELGIWYFGSD